MHKKRILLTGTIIILSVLFLNIVFSDRSAKTSLTLANIEAMAEQESPDGERKDLCLQAGYICVGIDKNGIEWRTSRINERRVIRYEKAILPFYRLIYFLPARQSRILQKKLPLCYIPGRDRCNSPKPIT